MGLLNFLAKKSYPDLAGHDSLKTSAYDTTVASSPPIRGTYPVLGNGSKILEEFQRSHPNLANISRNNSPAPSPLVPRLHGPGVDRPRTAPSSQLADTRTLLSLRSEPAPTLPVPPKKKYGPYKLPPRVMIDVRDTSLLSQPAPSPALVSPGLVSTYSDSVRSSENGKAKGYVDLLDAQSMIRPSDFYTRIQAAGAKNYGEDVADRNREEKPSNLDTVKAREISSSHTGGDWNTVISKDVDDDSDDEPRRPLKIRHSISSGLRPQKASSHLSESFPKRTSSRLPPQYANEVHKAMTRTESARSERAARRKSMPSFVASASSGAPRSSSMGKKGKEKDTEPFPESLRNHTRSATTYEREYSKPNISSKRQSLTPSHIGQQSPQKSTDLDKPLPALPPAARSHSRRKTTSHSNAVVESRLLAKRQSLQGMSSTSRGEIYEDTYQQKKSLQATKPSRDRNSTRRQLGSTTDLQDSLYSSPAQQPDLISQIISPPAKCTDNKDHPSQSNHARKQSAISLPKQSIMVAHETGSPIPERNSSLRRWSLTSETAMSTLSSNPFRPQSGHTTNTSVDFSPMFPRAFSDLIPPVPDIPSLKSLQSKSKSTSTNPPSSLSFSTTYGPQSSEFFLEDHVSDNGSSPSLSRSSYEKDLLFSETGYGVAGDQSSGLPGLFDTVPSADLSTSRTWGDEFQSVSNQFHVPDYPETDSNNFSGNQDQSDSSDDINFDIPKSRASSALHYTPVQERFPGMARPLEEDDDSDF
ncbi:hypothetical protein F5Y09DRAFT_300849 [Xylaria sp. FL1042]|nr:hypothetical protein F5Y09DRAFT_300849 [Xylaria sp. FL1042]